jgi:hypothetical protein
MKARESEDRIEGFRRFMGVIESNLAEVSATRLGLLRRLAAEAEPTDRDLADWNRFVTGELESMGEVMSKLLEYLDTVTLEPADRGRASRFYGVLCDAVMERLQ